MIGFGKNTFLVKISKFPITADVTCLRLRNFLKLFSKKKKFFFAQMKQKVIGFGQNTFLVKISKFPITAGVTCLRLRNFLKKFKKKRYIFFAQMEQKLIYFGQNTFLFKISKIPIIAGVTCFCSNGTKSDWFWSKHIFGQNFQIPHYSRCNVSDT